VLHCRVAVFEPVAVAFECDDVGVVDETIDHGCGDDIVAEDFAPAAYLQLDKRGAKLLFQVLTEREEKTAVALASIGSFSGWIKTFTDPHL